MQYNQAFKCRWANRKNNVLLKKYVVVVVVTDYY